MLKSSLKKYLKKREDSKFYEILKVVGNRYIYKINKIAKKHTYRATTDEAIRIMKECEGLRNDLLMLLKEYEKEDSNLLVKDEISLLEFIKIDSLYDCMEVSKCYRRVGALLSKEYSSFLYKYLWGDNVIGFTVIEGMIILPMLSLLITIIF